MKYLSINKLKDFNFHDTLMKIISYEEDSLKLEAKYLNIHKNTKQNNTNKDMEISLAEITFENFNLLYLKIIPAYRIDELGNKEKGEFIIEEKDAKNSLIEELKTGITIYSLDIEQNNNCKICISGPNQVFNIEFTFKNVLIKWNEYIGHSWYEDEKFNKNI